MCCKIFSASLFNGDVNFNSAHFAQKAVFNAVRFNGDVNFHADFEEDASFIDTDFVNDIDFDREP